jgi:hypothetical protein
MHREDLIQFLQDEADRALVTLFPLILDYLEKNYIVGKKVQVPIHLLCPSWRTTYRENIMVIILNQTVGRLEQLGYTAFSYYNVENNPCLEVK